MLAQDTLLINPAWEDAAVFGHNQTLTVDDTESYGANALWINDGVIYPSNFPRTQQSIGDFLEKQGMRMVLVEVSELQKAEGAVTCCSVIFQSKED